MNIISFYKQNIKQSAKLSKTLKYGYRRVQRYGTIKNVELQKQEQLIIDLELAKVPRYLKTIEERYLYLAYAVIRGKPLDKVEIKPKTAHDPEKLAKAIALLEQSYNERGEP